MVLAAPARALTYIPEVPASPSIETKYLFQETNSLKHFPPTEEGHSAAHTFSSQNSPLRVILEY